MACIEFVMSLMVVNLVFRCMAFSGIPRSSGSVAFSRRSKVMPTRQLVKARQWRKSSFLACQQASDFRVAFHICFTTTRHWEPPVKNVQHDLQSRCPARTMQLEDTEGLWKCSLVIIGAHMGTAWSDGIYTFEPSPTRWCSVENLKPRSGH